MPSKRDSGTLSDADLALKTIEGTLDTGGKVKLSRVQKKTRVRRAPPKTLSATASGRSTLSKKVEIGAGGMGTIFSVEQKTLERDVALKELRPELADDPVHRSKFLEEAIITGQIDHPNVPPTYHLDASRCRWTMKRIRGRDLEDILGEPFDLRRVLGILVSVCDALSCAHAKGVVHRDLKPENIMVGDEFNEVYLMDWGIARVIEVPGQPEALVRIRKTRKEKHGAIAGTPFYLSPEQASGDTEAIDERSDIYTMGCILYKVMTGRLPLTADNLIALLALKTSPKTVIAPPEGSRELAAVAMKALERDPDHRYQTVEAFKEDLQAFLTNGMVAVYDYGPVERLAKWVQQNATKTMGALALAGVGLALSIAIAAWVSVSAQQEGARRAQEEKKRAEKERDRARREMRGQQRAQAILNGLKYLRHDDGYYRAARSLISQAIEASRSYWRPHLLLAKLLADYGRHDEAEKAFAKANEVYADRFGEESVEIWFEAGLHYGLPEDLGGMGKGTKALAYFEKAKSAGPRTVYGRLAEAAALILGAREDASRADIALPRANNITWNLSRDPVARSMEATWLVRAWTLGSAAYDSYRTPAFLKHADFEGAAEALSHIVDAHRGPPSLRAFLAAIYRNLGENRKAIEVYTGLLAVTEKAHLYRNRGTAYYYMGKYREAEGDYAKAVSLNPNYGEAFRERGMTRNKLKKFDAAVRDFTRALDLLPRDETRKTEGEIHRLRGLAHHFKKRYARAVADYEQALRCRPGDWNAAWYLGMIKALNQERVNEGIGHLRQALAAAPASKKDAIRKTLSRAERKLGNR